MICVENGLPGSVLSADAVGNFEFPAAGFCDFCLPVPVNSV